MEQTRYLLGPGPSCLLCANCQVDGAIEHTGSLPKPASPARYLREVLACYSKDGQARACDASQIKRSLRSCSQAGFVLQNAR